MSTDSPARYEVLLVAVVYRRSAVLQSPRGDVGGVSSVLPLLFTTVAPDAALVGVLDRLTVVAVPPRAAVVVVCFEMATSSSAAVVDVVGAAGLLASEPRLEPVRTWSGRTSGDVDPARPTANPTTATSAAADVPT
jgi:hypothetical protein